MSLALVSGPGCSFTGPSHPTPWKTHCCVKTPDGRKIGEGFLLTPALREDPVRSGWKALVAEVPRRPQS